MPLILTIRNKAELSNGSPTTVVFDRRGAVIGRSPTSDWCLPDPALFISSRHCEVRFAGDRYELVDHSTNGTFMLGEQARLSGPHVIDQGDVFLIGEYEVEASLDEESAARLAAERAAAADEPREWQGWAAAGGHTEPTPPPSESSGWGSPEQPSPASGAQGWGPAPAAAPPPPPASSGWGNAPTPAAGDGWAPAPAAPRSGGDSGWGPAPAAAPPPGPPPAASSGWGPGEPAAPPPAPAAGWGASAAPPPAAPAWAPPPAPRDEAPVQSPWNVAPPPSASPASAWSSPAGSGGGSGDSVWGKIAASNVVDWARGGFGSAAPAPAPRPAPSGSVASANFSPRPLAQTETGTTQPPGPMPAASEPPAAAPNAGLEALLATAGVDPERLTQSEDETLRVAGDLLRRLVSGLVVMMEARARAKSQLGAQGTSLEFDGNNPLKFARTPEQALAQLLNPPERGFMPSDRAVEDAFKDLQAHQMATLMAMQGALRATLDRFSPKAIRSRAEGTGILGKILPNAHEAALWKAYEREFSGVAQGSDEAFMDMFAKEFRRAYEEMAHRR